MTPDPKRVRLAAVATATPPYVADQRQAADFFTRHFAHRLSHRSLELMRKFLAHPSIRERCFAIDGPRCLVAEHPDDKIARFLKWAVYLSTQASRRALAGAGLKPQEINALVVNTCTGYVCPGLTSYLIEELGLSRSIRAYDLVGSGCGGAVPNLQMGEEYLKANGEGAALCVSVEICSATFQMENDLSLILSNALFGDGAAAAVLWTRPRGLELVADGSRHQPEHREAIRYVNKNGQLYNQLSRSLPEIVSRAVAEAVRGVLAGNGLTAADIAHWALHSGGDRVITAIAGELGLPEEKLAPTRTVLARYGNMSSPSVLFSLREILNNGMRPQDWCVLASFGAGLSAHALLLRSR
ncbi:MAG: type III polyketide synthase [Deltaproteobacteria bacterium]|nr:type III polyketide synthase [Deltaproteobacteria bacterium]